MGVLFSCPFAVYNDVESRLESVLVKSIGFGDDDEVKTPVRSVSFSSRDKEPMILESSGSRKMAVEGSVSFKRMAFGQDSSSFNEDENVCIQPTSPTIKEMDGQFCRSDSSAVSFQHLPILDPCNPKHEAAIKLQKVYKSFRTRRKLADCAVLVEQSWWKLLDFAELKRSSISFFDIEKHETAISRWSRARTRAAKVGKGLSQNDKAQKLALQHWLEAIDPRHRYGHNLHFYYKKWLQSHSREPFFYWLDIGEGKEVNLDKCPRSKLQQQCIKYLGPMERKAYEVVVKDGQFFYKQTGELLDTAGEKKDKWIFVLSTSKTLYVAMKKKGTFQHSSFLAGGATIAAGRLVVENGILKAVWPHSGHYRPTEENFKDFQSFLRENDVDLTDVKMSPTDDDEELANKQRSSSHLRNNSSEEDIAEKLVGSEPDETDIKNLTQGKSNSAGQMLTIALEPSKSRRFQRFNEKLTHLKIPKRSDMVDDLHTESQAAEESINVNLLGGSPVNNCEQVEVPAYGGVDDELEENEVVPIPEESILKRINSHKGMRSYQLGRQLSCKWTTGAGPRIGCVRDYPSELQFRALEQVNLSPRSIVRSRLCSSSGTVSGLSSSVSTPTTLWRNGIPRLISL